MIELATNLLLKTLAAMVIIVVVNFGVLLGGNYLAFCVGLVLVAFVSFEWALPIAYVFDRFRLLRGFLPQIIFAVYLLTPILWKPARLGEHRWVVDFNPVFHVIEVARSPVISGAWPLTSIVVVLGLCFFGLLLSFLLYSANRELVVFRWIA
jgi:lipopolysaccharide transport system permease protein